MPYLPQHVDLGLWAWSRVYSVSPPSPSKYTFIHWEWSSQTASLLIVLSFMVVPQLSLVVLHPTPLWWPLLNYLDSSFCLSDKLDYFLVFLIAFWLTKLLSDSWIENVSVPCYSKCGWPIVQHHQIYLWIHEKLRQEAPISHWWSHSLHIEHSNSPLILWTPASETLLAHLFITKCRLYLSVIQDQCISECHFKILTLEFVSNIQEVRWCKVYQALCQGPEFPPVGAGGWGGLQELWSRLQVSLPLYCPVIV